MKLPKYIACIVSYYDTDQSVEVLKSIVISKTKDDSVVVRRWYDLTDYTDNEACDEIDSIIGYYKDRNELIDVIFGSEPLKLIRVGSDYEIRMITKEHYIKIMQYRKQRGLQ